MKLNIFYHSKAGSWGGGNQFLRALKSELIRVGVYEETGAVADSIIYNGYQEFGAVFTHWLLYKKQKIVYRLGPVMSLHRAGFKWRSVDALVVLIANICVGLVVFQSKWSHEEALKRGFGKNKKFAIIGNAVDSRIFQKKEFLKKVPDNKTKLVYDSWSSNIKKGFGYLKFLDENLDFDKYEFTFIGNSPLQFNNIKILKPLPSVELAEKLRQNDIFISPVEDDACSNALIEGLASGLPAVALRSGGNPELVGAGGELFANQEELLTKIDIVAQNLKYYYDAIQVKTIEQVAEEYIKAIEKIC